MKSTLGTFLDFLHSQRALDGKQNEGQCPPGVRPHGRRGGGLADGSDDLLTWSPWGRPQTAPGLFFFNNFFFFNYTILGVLYLFIYGCVGSSFLREGFL